MLLLCALIVGSSSAWAEDIESNFTDKDCTVGTNELKWTATNVKQFESSGSARGVQSEKNTTAMVFTSDATQTASLGTITKVVVTASANAARNLSVTVGGNTFGDTKSVSKGTANGNFTFEGSESGTIVITFAAASSSSTCWIKKVVVTYSNGDPNAPSITADNVNIAYNAEEGEIAYTINNPVEGGKLTASTKDSWIVPDDATASKVPFICDTNDGAKRTATITLTYTYDTDKTVTKNVTVTQAASPNAPGTENNPYTVAQARAAIDAGTGVNDVYATGYVSTTGTVNSSGAITYFISSDGSTTADQLEAYKGKGINGADFTSDDDIQLGDLVVIKGNLKKYSSIYEFDEGNQLVSLIPIQMIDLIKDCPLTFVEGSEFNHDGLVVIAKYADESTLDVTALAEFSEPDMTQIGQQTVLVNYGMFQTGYEITITEKPRHIATFSVNGTTSTNDFKEGTDIEFPEVTAPTGYTFMGWTATEITATQATAPDYITLPVAMGTSDVTYYAVFAVVSGTPATLTKMASTDTFEDGDNVVIVAKDGDKDYAIYQETASNSWVAKYEFDGNVSTVAADDKNWLTVTANDGNWKLGDATNGYLYSSGSNNLNVSTENSSSFTLAYSSGNGFTLKYGNRWLALRTDTENNTFRLGGTGSSPLGTGYFDIYKYVAGSATYSDYCTTVTKEIATVTSYGWATYIPSHAVEFPANRAYVVTEVSNEGKTTVEAVEKVPAGTPLLLKGEGQVTADIIDEEVDAPTTNMLSIGTGTTPDGKFPYVLAKNGEGKAGFKLWTGAASVLKDRVVMMLDSEISGNGSRNFLFLEDGETTAIDVRSKMDDVRGEYFNLNGQRVAQPTKGLYIVNGKKVVVK